jgi:hypothetical protein
VSSSSTLEAQAPRGSRPNNRVDRRIIYYAVIGIVQCVGPRRILVVEEKADKLCSIQLRLLATDIFFAHPAHGFTKISKPNYKRII